MSIRRLVKPTWISTREEVDVMRRGPLRDEERLPINEGREENEDDFEKDDEFSEKSEEY